MATVKLSMNVAKSMAAEVTREPGGSVTQDVELTFKDTVTRPQLHAALMRLRYAIDSSGRQSPWGVNKV